ncbi:hypothetical protein BD410DRAFT_386033 [Rickenella mellea]|uniref:F-box domain-containing protein n=1 Tax=Rickenella mellea TaxID=50990 RepID=A0A4Y7PXS8_9AGAM|nr:hypothetical protein BD410DRAFT_386033 [Rickenella mellea]
MAHLAEPVRRLQFVLAQSFPYMPFDDLSALSRTSRVLCRLARRDLFKVVKPRKLSTAITFCESVRSHSDLGLHVRVLHFQFDLTKRSRWFSRKRYSKPFHYFLDSLPFGGYLI